MSAPLGIEMHVRKIGQWDQARLALSRQTIRRLHLAQRSAVKKEARRVRKMVISGLRSQSPGGKKLQRLALSTRRMRRATNVKGSKALVARGRFMNSIRVIERTNSFFIGVPKAARDGRGKSIAKIIRLQEKGAVIVMKITPKMIAFLRKSGVPKKKGSPNSGGVMIIRIKPRPVFGPINDEYKANLNAARLRIWTSISKRLRGLYGFPG